MFDKYNLHKLELTNFLEIFDIKVVAIRFETKYLGRYFNPSNVLWEKVKTLTLNILGKRLNLTILYCRSP